MSAADSTIMQNRWRVDLDAGDAAAYAALAADRPWTGYAIADLEPPFRQHARVALARRLGASPAACLLLRHPAFSVTVTHGAPEGVAAILTAVELPEATEISVRPEHLPLLRRHFHFPTPPWEMLRMHLTSASFVPPPAASFARVERLGPADADALLDLYHDYADSAFFPDQLTGGVFYGVREQGQLVAAGGTHVVSERYGIAAVGNIYTRAAMRGRGLGGAITAAVVAELLARGCHDLILNVRPANTVAIGIYRRLGFGVHCRFWEGDAVRR